MTNAQRCSNPQHWDEPHPCPMCMGAQRVEEIRKNHDDLCYEPDACPDSAIHDLLARLRVVENAGKVLVEANTRHFNAAREAEDKLRAVEAEKEVAVSEMIGLREVLRSVEGEQRYPDDPARSVAAMLSRLSPDDKQAFNFCVKTAAAQAEAEARRLRAQVASVWLRMQNLTTELEDLLESPKGAPNG